MLIALNKPCGVLCQFTDPQGRPTLADHIDVRGVYAAGRLDKDSEGLVLLTDDGRLQNRISAPRFGVPKTYLVQVEGDPADGALERLRAGVALRDGSARALQVQRLAQAPDWVWPRQPPVRYRKSVPMAWLELQIDTGRNRQVRRMTAAVGYPTLRLIRTAVGHVGLDGLASGAQRILPAAVARRFLAV